jgi:hypothetical protein
MVLRQDTSSAGTARRFVRETLSQGELEQYMETAALLISELVTNAVLHARAEPEVVISAVAGVVRIEVHDASPVMPARRYYGTEAGTGRGIMLVEEMSTGWGAEPRGSGKVVWFELAPGHEAKGSADIALDAATLADLADLADLAEVTGTTMGERGSLDERGDAGPSRPRACTRARTGARIRRGRHMCVAGRRRLSTAAVR